MREQGGNQDDLNFGSAWYSDRAQMLQATTSRAPARSARSGRQDSWRYDDADAAISVLVSGATLGAGERRMRFGSDRETGSVEPIEGGQLADVLYGNGGADSLLGGAGDDRLDGGSGADSLSGGSGVDTLFGGAGADTLAGGSEADAMYGGGGFDSYRIDAGDRGDVIFDSDGNGEIRVGNTVLAVGERIAPNQWRSQQGQFVLNPGIPVLCLPTHLEQALTAGNVIRQGLGKAWFETPSAPGFVETVASLAAAAGRSLQSDRASSLGGRTAPAWENLLVARDPRVSRGPDGFSPGSLRRYSAGSGDRSRSMSAPTGRSGCRSHRPSGAPCGGPSTAWRCLRHCCSCARPGAATRRACWRCTTTGRALLNLVHAKTLAPGAGGRRRRFEALESGLLHR